jgi:hypothetical protein
LRLTRYALAVVFVALVVVELNILWALLSGLHASPSWLSRFFSWLSHLNIEVFGIKVRLASAAPTDALPLLMTNTGLMVMIALTVCVLVWFERKEREAAVRPASLPPPLPLKIIPHLPVVEATPPERQLTLTEGLERQPSGLVKTE